MRQLYIVAGLGLCVGLSSCSSNKINGMIDSTVHTMTHETKLFDRTLPIDISGGHDLPTTDKGRPVVLMAPALGVSTDVLRAAFKKVDSVKPDATKASQQQAVLLKALSRYGVTNAKLNEVLNYYKHDDKSDQLWPTQPAEVVAVIKSGNPAVLTVVKPGSGYTSPPTFTLRYLDTPETNCQLIFSSTLNRNGSIGTIKILPRDREK